MKRFITHSLIFTLPFAVLYLYTRHYYRPAEGDLVRLGMIPDVFENAPNPKIEIEKQKMQQPYYEMISDTDKRKFRILVVGDSFSGQGNFGYKNYLAKDNELLWLNYSVSDNPIQTLTAMVNSDFFENYEIEYVILQSVERSVIKRIKELNPVMKLTAAEIISRSKSQNSSNAGKDAYKFFSNATVTFPVESAKFFYKENYLSNQLTYCIELNTGGLFSNGSRKLLCYASEVRNLAKNNPAEDAAELNGVLNLLNYKLKEKNVKLIFLAAADKYDFYYDYISNKTGFEKPLFFDNFGKLDKDYIYIDSKSILSHYSGTEKDIYYFGDTHWSSVSAKIIADSIGKELKN